MFLVLILSDDYSDHWQRLTVLIEVTWQLIRSCKAAVTGTILIQQP